MALFQTPRLMHLLYPWAIFQSLRHLTVLLNHSIFAQIGFRATLTGLVKTNFILGVATTGGPSPEGFWDGIDADSMTNMICTHSDRRRDTHFSQTGSGRLWWERNGSIPEGTRCAESVESVYSTGSQGTDQQWMLQGFWVTYVSWEKTNGYGERLPGSRWIQAV